MSAPSTRAPLVVLSGVPEVYGHGLAHALSAAGADRVVRTDGEDLLAVLEQESASAPAVLVVPEATADRVRATLLGTPVEERVALVHLSLGGECDAFATAVSSGALGVLDPAVELEAAVEVVLSAAAGRVVIPEHVLAALSEPPSASGAPQVAEHEREWLRMLGQGGTVAAVARSASYSEREMYRLLAKLYRRLGAETRTEALLRAADWGLLDEGGHVT
ncbi:hypothetical protein [Kineococcus esterisolvens]|uniref:hypothetical protein n=1 Tax=unclassified Kineococcus TaxID=2621656 RepID=UPI003D7CBA8F